MRRFRMLLNHETLSLLFDNGSGEFVTCHGCMKRSGILPLSWISPFDLIFKTARASMLPNGQK
jgi:hypothetical protein